MKRWQHIVIKIYSCWIALILCTYLIIHPTIPTPCSSYRVVHLDLGYHCTWNWHSRKWQCLGSPAFDNVYIHVCQQQ